MLNVLTLIEAADAFKSVSNIEADTTLSYRMFGDTKKLNALRSGGDITVGRFNTAMQWLVENWPAEKELPSCLSSISVDKEGASS